eukprot:g15318.t1
MLGSGRVADEVGGGGGDSPHGIEMGDMEDRLRSSSRAHGFSLVAAADGDEEQLVGGGARGTARVAGAGAGDSRQHLSSDRRTFVNLLISFVGAGILGIPFAYRQGGLLLSTGVLAIVGVACTYCMWMLVRCKYRVIAMRGKDEPGPVKYADICHEALGKWGLVAAEGALVASQSGFSTAYLVFIARNLHALFEFQETPVIFLCVPGLVLLCLIKHLKYLAPFSLIAEVVNLTGLAVVFFDDAEFMGINHESISMVHWKALPFVFGVGVYCFEGMGMVIPIEDAMINREKFAPILSVVMVIYTSLCILSGGLGYLAFGDETRDIILLNIGSTTSTLIVKLSFCVGLYFTFPIMMVPVWEVLEFNWLRHHSPSYGQKRNMLRAAVVLGTGFLACAIPNFGLFVSLIGSSCCALLAFVLPALCYTRLETNAGFPLGPARSFTNNLVVAAGVFAMVYGTGDTLDESPFLQRKSFRSAAGGAGSRRRSGNPTSDTTSKKRRETTTTTTAGLETPFPANSARSAAPASSADVGLGRRPRELPWLVTPPPSVNQASTATAAAVSSSSRRARPATSPATAAGPASGGGDEAGGLSRSASLASAAGERLHPQQDYEQQQQGPKRGAAGQPRTSTRATTVGAAGGRGGAASEERGMPLAASGKERDDPEAERFPVEVSEAAAALAASEWARQRRRALACAGSMEVPVGSSSSASAGAGSGGGGDAQPESSSTEPLFGIGSGSAGSESLSFGGRGGDGSDEGQPKTTTDGRGVLPAIPPPHPASPKKARTANVRAAAWLALLKTVTFVEKSSAAMRATATSAIPLDGLEDGLLALRPFRFGDFVDDGDGLVSSVSSSSSTRLSSAPSSCSFSDTEQSEDGGGYDDAGGPGSHDAPQSSVGARERRGGKGACSIEREIKESPPAMAPGDTPVTSPAASPPEAQHGTAATAARPDASGGYAPPSSPGLRSRDKPRLGSRVARGNRRNGWVRGGAIHYSSRGPKGRRSGSGQGVRSPTPTPSGRWAPPPTHWGGTPIKSAAFWGSWGEASAAVAHARQEGEDDPSGGPHSGRNIQSPFVDDGRGGFGEHVSGWGEEEGQGDENGLDAVSEFFRTADGRSLFAESLDNTSGDGSIKRVRREIRWGEEGDNGPRDGRHRGFLCLLGEEGCPPSERGAEEARRLGVAARQRRSRIDARSRDGKRRAEKLVAREKIKRLEEECISRRTDKLEWRANLTKSRGEAEVQVVGDRAKTLLWVVALASRTRNLGNRVVDAKKRRAILRNRIALADSAMRVQRVWRKYRRKEEAPPKERGILDHIQTISRVSSRFVVCKRARMVALLKLWPEGELAIKLEMRTGKRIRAEGSWRAASHRRSSRAEAPHSVASRGSVLGAAGGGGATYSAAAAAAASAANAAAAVAHAPASWFPPLVQQMESRKNETAQNLIKSQGKASQGSLFRHRQANEGAWISMNPVGRAYQQGRVDNHLQQQRQLQRHARPNHRSRPGGEETLGSSGDAASGAGSLSSDRTDATSSTKETAMDVPDAAGAERAAQQSRGGQRQHRNMRREQRKRRKHRPRPSSGAISSARSGEDDDTQGSLSTGIGSLEEESNTSSAGGEGGERAGKEPKKKKSHARRTSGHGGRRGSGAAAGAGGGGMKRRVSISAEEGIGNIFDDGAGGGGGGSSGGGGGGSPASAAPAPSGVQFSRTTPAASSSGQVLRVFSATGGMHHAHGSNKKAGLVRDLTSMQLLAGGGWLARLAESFMRAEMARQGKFTRRDRMSQRVHQEEATMDTAKALLQNSIEDFEDQVEAANSRENHGLLQFFSGSARSRFKAEVDKRVRAYMEKGGSRRAQIGVRT